MNKHPLHKLEMIFNEGRSLFYTQGGELTNKQILEIVENIIRDE